MFRNRKKYYGSNLLPFFQVLNNKNFTALNQMGYSFSVIGEYTDYLLSKGLIRRYNVDGRKKKLDYTAKGVELFYLLEKIDALLGEVKISDALIVDNKKEEKIKGKGEKKNGKTRKK